MLDVHPPHESAHSWRDFLIHIATICVGLLIAVGLEQAVEALHHRHQAAELRETLHDEAAQVLTDSQGMVAITRYSLQWNDQRMAQVKAALWEHRALAPATPFHRPVASSPDIPHWRAAKQSGLIFHLSQGEITAYSEVEYVQAMAQSAVVVATRAHQQSIDALALYPTTPGKEPDLSHMSSEDLREYLKALIAERSATSDLLSDNLLLMGAEEAVQHGETNLNRIYQSEGQRLFQDPEFKSH